MRIYFDNCCFNRPFDDQSQIRIRLEAESKLFIQQKVLEKKIELVWSYILDYENGRKMRSSMFWSLKQFCVKPWILKLWG
jgi:hypothetical protein